MKVIAGIGSTITLAFMVIVGGFITFVLLLVLLIFRAMDR